MPWDDNSGNNQNPWGNSGRGPNRGRGPGRGPGGNEPDLDEIIRNIQNRIRGFIPGSGGGSSLIFILAAFILIWGLSGFYRVQADEQGVVLRFGKFQAQTSPGLNYHLPWPIETVFTPKVTTVNRADIGMRASRD